MNATNTNDRLIILDDGDYYIELDSNCSLAAGPGYLQRRCYEGVTTPGGYECVGSFDKTPSNTWTANINANDCEKTGLDTKRLGEYKNRLDAVMALWKGRHKALCKHQDS